MQATPTNPDFSRPALLLLALTAACGGSTDGAADASSLGADAGHDGGRVVQLDAGHDTGTADARTDPNADDSPVRDAAIPSIPIDDCLNAACDQLPKAKRLVHAVGRDCEQTPGQGYSIAWRKTLVSPTCKPAGGCHLTTTDGFVAPDGTFWVLASLRTDTRIGLWLGRLSSTGALLGEHTIERRVATLSDDDRFYGLLALASDGRVTVASHRETGASPSDTMSNAIVFDAISSTPQRLALISEGPRAFHDLASAADGSAWLLHQPDGETTTHLMAFAPDGAPRWTFSDLPWAAASIADAPSHHVVIGAARSSRIDGAPCLSITSFDDAGKISWDVELDATDGGLVSDTQGRLLHQHRRSDTSEDDAGTSSAPRTHFERISADGQSVWSVRLEASLAGPRPFDPDGNAYAIDGSLWSDDTATMYTISHDGSQCVRHAVAPVTAPAGADTPGTFFHPAAEHRMYFHDGNVVGMLD